MKATVGPHETRQIRSAKAAFGACRGAESEQVRSEEIEALPVAEWKGKQLRTLRCHGVSGKGPHDVNVPESLLWSLIDLKRYECPFHRQ